MVKSMCMVFEENSIGSFAELLRAVQEKWSYRIITIKSILVNDRYKTVEKETDRTKKFYYVYFENKELYHFIEVCNERFKDSASEDDVVFGQVENINKEAEQENYKHKFTQAMLKELYKKRFNKGDVVTFISEEN